MIYLGHRKTKQNISKNKDVISFLKANGVFFIQEVGLHEKLEIIKKILVNHNCLGLTVYSVMGCGRQKGHISKAENDDVATNLLPKIYVMTVVKDSELKLIMNDIYNEIGTGTHGDGKVFVSNIEDAMRIRTGECGENAL